MRVAFRVDAGSSMGMGHFMRCLTLADALRKNGAEACFACRELPGYVIAMLADKGIAHDPLVGNAPAPPAGDLAHSSWLWTDQDHDAEASLLALGKGNWDWLVVDHYALDHRWESRMRSIVRKIMVIDDLADRRHDCDLLLDQNYYLDKQTRYEGKVPAECRLLLGPRYALLRDEFRELRQQVGPRTGQVKRIQVFFGGVDAENYTGRAVEALTQLHLANVHVDVIIGALHPCRAQIEQACAEAGYTFHVQTPHMAQLTAAADLAIGAGGTAIWERCCLGLPALSVCVADNQRKQISDAATAGLLYELQIQRDLIDSLKHHTMCLIENASLLRMISHRAMDAVDGQGTLYVAEEIGAERKKSYSKTVAVRLAATADAQMTWPWRTSESTRRYSFDPRPVSLEMHVAWWNKSLIEQHRILLIGATEGRDFGVVRFDLNNHESAAVSIYLDPTMVGMGLGRALLNAGLQWLRQNRPKIEKASAEVFQENIASLRLFLSAGFTEQYKGLVRVL